jgi:hypothetical protein
MLRSVVLVRTDILEECIASNIRVIRIGEQGITLSVISNRSTLHLHLQVENQRSNKPECSRCLSICQKMAITKCRHGPMARHDIAAVSTVLLCYLLYRPSSVWVVREGNDNGAPWGVWGQRGGLMAAIDPQMRRCCSVPLWCNLCVWIFMNHGNVTISLLYMTQFWDKFLAIFLILLTFILHYWWYKSIVTKLFILLATLHLLFIIIIIVINFICWLMSCDASPAVG